MDDNSGDENPYRELIVNNAAKIDSTLSQMKQWSILSNIINYMQYSKNPKKIHALLIKPINRIKINVGRKGGRERHIYIMDKSHGHFR